jgi:hypothetical protein
MFTFIFPPISKRHPSIKNAQVPFSRNQYGYLHLFDAPIGNVLFAGQESHPFKFCTPACFIYCPFRALLLRYAATAGMQWPHTVAILFQKIVSIIEIEYNCY